MPVAPYHGGPLRAGRMIVSHQHRFIFVAIPKTSKVERLSENLAIFDFALTDAEMKRMSALTRPGSRLVNEPQWVPEWD